MARCLAEAASANSRFQVQYKTVRKRQIQRKRKKEQKTERRSQELLTAGSDPGRCLLTLSELWRRVSQAVHPHIQISNLPQYQNGKIGNYYNGLYRGYMGIMEKKMETTLINVL